MAIAHHGRTKYDACTDDSCSGGQCTNIMKDCDDGDACTSDSCTGGACTHVSMNCDDADAFTNDSCSGGYCSNIGIECDDGNPRTNDFCSEGACIHDAAPLDGTSCTDDGNLCTDDFCSGGACTHPLNCPAGQPCCGNGECCATTCEGCLDNGSLTEAVPGDSITVSPTVACLGDTITWTASGVTDSVGIKRVDCSANQAIAAGGVTYEWTLTLPTDYPAPLPAPTGPGASVNVEAKVVGIYSCNYTAKPSRTECPPEDLDLGTESRTVSSTATLTLTPSVIAATTAWPGMPAGLNQTNITVTWAPPECVGTLAIVELDTSAGYTPPSEETLEKIDDTNWLYTAFDGPSTEKCPNVGGVRIGALQGGIELARKNVQVWPVHSWWITNPHQDFQKDYQYITWKYATVLATTGGAFTSVTISSDGFVYCGFWPLGTDAFACTNAGTAATEIGTETFTRTENQAASIIGHELLQASGVFSECSAYTWEVNNQGATGILQCAPEYRADVLQKTNCECNGICP